VPLPCASPRSASGRSITPPPTGAVTSPPPTPLPQVTSIFPVSGSAGGGDSVTISGTGFIGATAVHFGSVSIPITPPSPSDTQITVMSPPGNGMVDVTVVTPNGTSSTSPADKFSYQGEQPT